MAKTKVISDSSLIAAGFSQDEIKAADSNGYVGEKDGIEYFRAEIELNIGLGDFKTRSVKMPDQMGERTE